MKALAVIVILSGGSACSHDTTPARSDASAAVEVRVATAAVAVVPQTFEAGGVVTARMTAQMSPRIAAELREVAVRPGDRVRKGQILAVLDDRDLAANRARAHASVAAAQSGAASAVAQRESAEAQLALARATHQRVAQLRDRNSATPQEMDRATAELHMAEAGVRAAHAHVDEASASATAAQAAARAADTSASFSTIAAPFDGLVTNRLLEPGNMAAPGTPLLTVETTDGFRLEVQVDAARAHAIDVGDAVTVEVDGLDEADTLTGRVVEVARAIDPGTHAFVVKIQLPAGTAVRSGAFARARFARDERNTLVVPEAAVVRRGQLSIVFVVDSSRHARMRAITPGARSGESVEVLAGIQPGETVVVSPPAPLVDGSELRLMGGRP
jgi:RND family efflux transporter MFP subunit